MYTIIKLHMTQFSVFYYVPMSLVRDCCSTVITSNYPSEHWMALLLFLCCCDSCNFAAALHFSSLGVGQEMFPFDIQMHWNLIYIISFTY